MQFSVHCIECLVKRQAKLANAQHNEEEAFKYMREVLQIILDAPAGVAAPYLIYQCNQAFARHFRADDRYAEIKRASNAYLLEKAPAIRQLIQTADDRLLLALSFARAGNYIDFGALGDNVDDRVLDALLTQAPEEKIDAEEYAAFRADLDQAQRMLYIADNAGEIVLDRLLIEELLAYRPELEICLAVRGGAVLNDALREDAAAVGLTELVSVIDSGVAVSGTQISMVGPELRRALEEADLILAKGQGNFETMLGCGLNVYYTFLCKCDWFTELFQTPKLSGMFLNERRIRVSL